MAEDKREVRREEGYYWVICSYYYTPKMNGENKGVWDYAGHTMCEEDFTQIDENRIIRKLR